MIESYFEDDGAAEAVDVVASLFREHPIQGWRSYEGATILIDLGSDPELIFAAFTKGLRYEIKRAEKQDGLDISVVAQPSGAELAEFTAYYDRFAVNKGLPRVNRPQVGAVVAAGKGALSFARTSEGSLLAAHAYVVAGGRARLTHSASLFRLEHDSGTRATIGRANRILHWCDLLSFRANGATCYDLGGWYEGSNEMLLRVNAFKEAFGGEIVREWSSFKAESLLGSLYLRARDRRLRRGE
jgi:hypothetical protein